MSSNRANVKRNGHRSKPRRFSSARVAIAVDPKAWVRQNHRRNLVARLNGAEFVQERHWDHR